MFDEDNNFGAGRPEIIKTCQLILAIVQKMRCVLTSSFASHDVSHISSIVLDMSEGIPEPTGDEIH